MLNGERILAVIPARGGSKGLPGKNIRLLGGRPLIAWTIDAARNAGCLDRILVSTDDPAIAAAAERESCPPPFLRPAALAGDDTPTVEVVLHALEQSGEPFDLVVMLQPTSPLRRAEDIDAAVALCLDRGAPACVSVALARKPPEWLFRLSPDGRLSRLFDGTAMPTNRQAAMPAVLPNGAVFVARTAWLQETRSFYGPDTIGFPMPAARSIDIDDEIDFQLAALRLAAS